MPLSILLVLLTASPTTRIALVPLTAGEGVGEPTTEAVTQAVAAELRRYPALQLLTRQELSAVLTLDRQKALVGCPKEQCLIELGEVLDVEQLVMGSVAKLGQSLVVHLQRVDARKAAVLSTSDRRKKGGSMDDLLDELPQMVRELLPGFTPAGKSAEPVVSAAVGPATASTVPPSWKDEPLEVDRRKLRLVSDGKDFFVAFNSAGGMEGPLFSGDGKALYAQRVFGGQSEGTTKFSLVFWDPRASVPAEAAFDFRDGAYFLTCGQKKIPLQAVPQARATKVLAEARLLKPRWARRAYALARDEEGTTFFVDQAREPSDNTDFRVFVGTPGKMVGEVPDVLASDSDGELLAVRGGKLRLSHAKREAESIRGGQKTKLLWLEVEANARRIYSSQGAYPRERLGTPCDGQF